MAMTDEDITDEVLVMELERMRIRKEWSGSVDEMGEIWDPDYVLFGTFGSQDLRHSKSPADVSYTPSLPSFPHQHRNSSVPLPESGSTQQWQTARRVLLTCRELVRTERHYLASLQILLASETEGTPPLLMLRYAEELVKVSQLYLAQMEGNPSAWGVAAAFLGAEEAVDGAFVGWCGVVGMWFDDSREGPMKSEESAEEDESTKDRLKKIGSWRRSLTSIADLSTNAPSTKKKEKGSAPPPSSSLYGHRQRRMSKTKKPPIRDLAILPTQRIMRYVLLYRDLLAQTPSTSPSRGLIKRAADAAFRIAQKCDRAQTNSAFIVDKKRDTAAPVKATSTTNSNPSSNSEGDADQLSSSISKPDSSRSENS
ncbi:hypothetical protein AN958_06689 [Leucoagaricus sp. SymC.cos]|nr:hypothetical protein AN958_06689 [Leucoagaricus sp. SymC.cos]